MNALGGASYIDLSATNITSSQINVLTNVHTLNIEDCYGLRDFSMFNNVVNLIYNNNYYIK